MKPSEQRPSADQIRGLIAEAAYYRAEQRGFQPGLETDDWLAAESEILARVQGNAIDKGARPGAR